MLVLDQADPLAVTAVSAIREGRLGALRHLLAEHPDLAAAHIARGGQRRSLLHIATDWPGHFPDAARTVALLVDAGADVNARFVGAHAETPLHWAASSDDVSALDALLDHGADIHAIGGVIADGTALADAVAFGQWRAARRLVERGAVANLWQAAALGLLDRVEAGLSAGTATPQEVTVAFWCACHGGQHSTAMYLLDRGADLNWVGFDGLTPLDAALRSAAEPGRAASTALVAWLRERGARSTADPAL